MSELIPTTQAHDVQQGLLDYLTTTFALADPDARLALQEFLTDQADGIFKGPYLRLRLPFRPADDGWRQALEWHGGFTPYGHQAETFRRLSSAGLGPEKPRPLPTLVTTGTGSGKTEAFLYPILDHVLRDRRAGRAGMKALILYPMNALANDQAGRLASLLTSNEALKGITAALYTGQEGPKTTMVTPGGLITDRAVIRSEAPDILLTNYKMLDQLLLRADDQPLWASSALSLRYLVLDEFHTYDGAQGTDVAMLLRRLGFALKSHWPDDESIPQEARRRPLGWITPVATSATLGDRGDPEAMVRFARKVFGEEFDSSGVVTESRMGLAEWAGDAAEQVASWGLTVAEEPAWGDLASVAGDAPSRELAVQVLAVLYGTDPASMTRLLDDDPGRMLALVQAHPLVHGLIGQAEQACHTGDLASALGVEPEHLVAVVGLLSHVRATCGRAAPNVDLHVWVRELTRIERIAAATTRYLWGDDGALALPGAGGLDADPFSTEGRPAFPAVYCRHCGRSGWGVELAPTGHDLNADDTQIRRNHAAREGRFRALLSAPMEAEHSVYGVGADETVEGLRWFSVKQRAVLVSPPPDDDPDFRDGWILPVLALTGPDADEDSRQDTCPSCLQRDGIRFLGSAIATLLSVTLSTLFGAEGLDAAEKKALVFTDSVQDAAHRAGFVQNRSHALTLRAVFRAAAGDEGAGPVGLEMLVDEAIRQARDDPFARYRLIPPELVERSEFEPFWKAATARAVPARVRARVRRRLLFDAVLEFGLNSRVGRTLEQTGSVVAEVDAPAEAGLVAIGRAVLAGDGQPALDDVVAAVPDAAVLAWVRGVLEHLRERGAVDHEWFGPYIQEDGNRYRIWGGRPRGQGMPAFPKGRSVPGFPRVGPALTTADPLLDPVTSVQSWHARWAVRNLQVSAQHGARLAKVLLERLARADVLTATTTASGGTAYAIPASAVLVRPASTDELERRECLLECTVCRNAYPGTPLVVRQLTGAPCLLVRCPGVLRVAVRQDNYYRRLYASTDVRRIVAREHSSLLDDETRLAYETAFKHGQGDPHAPNVLVATPTLEMGIDIGDLSTVMLASLPRTVASYLQRVGRAGRLTGNALNLAFVTGRGEHLPRLGDPLSVVNGQVRPPATYLDAEEILQRQYVAHLIDALGRDPQRPHPKRATATMAAVGSGTFLGELTEFAETDAAGHLDRFLGAFEGQSEATVAALRAWATPEHGPSSSGLAAQLAGACERWVTTQQELTQRQASIQAVLPGLDKIAGLPAASDDDKRAARSALAALRLTRGLLGKRRSQPWIQALEEAGILPNYTLLDDDVTLDVALTWIDPDTQEFRTEDVSYHRSSASALHEFAPGATFYARGLEIAIDSIDLGIDGAAVREWAFCPECGYARDRSPGGVPVVQAPCPRCGGTGILDAKQQVDVVELTRVTAELRRDEAAITDRRDERQRERFTVFTAADIDPAEVTARWFVAGYDFGVKYLRRMDVRWVNAGRAAGFGPARTIGGYHHPAGMFRVCTGCGKLDKATGANRPDEHRPWCRYRTTTQESTRSLALTRTLTTQGVVLRLPPSVTIGDTFAVPSLAAGVLLGLHEQLGGTPDHIAVASVADPTFTVGGGESHEALLLHDVVPGGTGYLAELADPARMWDLLHRAWALLRDCPCQDEARLACHRCLVPFAGPNLPVTLLSRQAAERHLRAILTSGLGGDVADDIAWTLTDVAAAAASKESHLEQYFREVFTERVRSLGATVKEVPGAKGNILRITFPGGARQWQLQPQVMMGGSQPDFVLQSNDPNIPAVAIFTDGWLYHASLSHNRLADDARKRRDLRDSGVVVLAVTARDVEAAADPVAPGWFEADVVAALREQYPFSSRTTESITGGPFGFLLSWLQKPEVAEERALAEALPLLFARAPGQLHHRAADADLARAAADLLTGVGSVLEGAPQPGESPAWWWRKGACGVLARSGAGGGIDLAVVLDDRDASIGEQSHRGAWFEWLRISNAVSLRAQPTTVCTLTEALAGATSSTGQGVVPAGTAAAAVNLAPEWQALLETAVPDERAFLVDLAHDGALPVPVIGYETEHGIPIDIAWEELRIAVYATVHEQDRRDLEANGWQVLEADVDAVRAALKATPGGDS